MIEVEGPDGSIHEFPDGTAPDIIKGAMGKRYGASKTVAPSQPSGGFFDTVKREGASAVQAADDIVRLMANAATGGYADKFASYMGGEPIETERAKSEAAAERAGGAGTVAGIVGTLAPAGAIGKGVAGAAKAIENVPALGRLAGSGLARSGATGAGLGVLGAGGGDTDIGTGAAIGAVAGLGGQALGSGISSGVGKVAGLFNKRPMATTIDELKEAGRAGYKSMSDSGAMYSPQGVFKLAQGIEGTLAQNAYEPELAPAVPALLRALERYNGKNATIEGVQSLRQIASNISQSGDEPQRRLGSMLVGKVDDFLTNPEAGDIIGGNAAQAAKGLKEGNKFWTRFKKSSALERELENARLRTGSSGSGGNIDNATRQAILRARKNVNNWTPDELAAIDDAITGSTAQNAARLFGKLSPVGNGLIAALDVGGFAANKMLGLPIAAGAASKYLADKATQVNANRLAELIASGGSKAALEPAPNALQRLSESKREALIRALMSAGVMGGESLTAQ